MDRDPVAASTRRILFRALLLLAPLVALALAAPQLLSALSARGGGGDPPAARDRAPTDDERAASARADLRLAAVEEAAGRRSVAIAPEEAQENAAGERVRRFEGFGVSVETVPSGAWVRANGEELGKTPLVASVPCNPGAPVALEMGAARRRPVHRTVTCRDGELLELSVRLPP
jgi:hypothetical protein